MKVAVHGSYYGRNFGDTLIIKVIVDWLKHLDNAKIILPFIKDDIEAKEIGAERYNGRIGDLNSIDKFIFAGGGYFGEPNKNIIKRNFWYFRNWDRHLRWNKKINSVDKIIIGVGFGPIRNKYFRNRVLDLFDSSHKVIVRDVNSMEYLYEYGYRNNNLELGVDLAYSLSSNKKPISSLNLDKIALHIPIYEHNYIKKYMQIIEPIVKKYKVEIISDQESANILGQKKSLIRELIDKYNIEYVKYNGVDDLLKRLTQYKSIITSKLHVGIVSTNLGVPVYSIPMHSKTERYYRQINYYENCNPIYKFDQNKNNDIVEKLMNLNTPVIPDESISKLNDMKNKLVSFVES
jgi:polysaccharide pyruvyl transferase WcaK-like protein